MVYSDVVQNGWIQPYKKLYSMRDFHRLRKEHDAKTARFILLCSAAHYRIDEKGVHVSQGEETGDLEWKQIYKMVSTKNNLLIYSNRMNAYVIPREALGQKYETVVALAINHLDGYRLKLNPFRV